MWTQAIKDSFTSENMEKEINRDNWLLSKKYLEHRHITDDIKDRSLSVEKNYVRYLLEWAQEIHFSKAYTIRPSLKVFLLETRLDGAEGQLSYAHMKKILATGRRFFQWGKDYKKGFSEIHPTWIKTLDNKNVSEIPRVINVVILDEILAISRTPVNNLPEKRTRAMAVFLYLSGTRIGAFVSLRLNTIDIDKREIWQYPSLGVKTKNKKYAQTTLLPIPELLEVVKDWDNELRRALPEEGFWFAPLRADTGQIDVTALHTGKHRESLARRNLKNWLEKKNHPYRTPHGFRHGHIHWGRDHSKDMTDFKAVSENVMHSDTRITDKHYSRVKGNDLNSRIQNLGHEIGEISNKDEALLAIEEILKNLKNQK